MLEAEERLGRTGALHHGEVAEVAADAAAPLQAVAIILRAVLPRVVVGGLRRRVAKSRVGEDLGSVIARLGEQNAEAGRGVDGRGTDGPEVEGRDQGLVRTGVCGG